MTWKIYQHPSESGGSSPEAKPEEQKPVEAVTSPIDPLAQLQADLTAAKAETAEWQDRFLRKAAEFENYRKRVEKEKADSMMIAKSSILLEFLPIADACERGLESIDKVQSIEESIEQYRDGVELLYKQLLDTLVRTGVVPMEAKGKKFDPHFHEALLREETADFEENTVITEWRRGYFFKDRILRPAQVVVSKLPQNNKTPSS